MQYQCSVPVYSWKLVRVFFIVLPKQMQIRWVKFIFIWLKHITLLRERSGWVDFCLLLTKTRLLNRCPMCSTTFTEKYRLKVHIKQMHEKTAEAICDHCGKLFGHRSLVKLKLLPDHCIHFSNPGQIVIYFGTVFLYPRIFLLDHLFSFRLLYLSYTWAMLE